MRKRYSVVYAPRGAAAEYSELAVNLYEGCRHYCKYCYVPKVLHKTPVDFHAYDIPRLKILENLEKDLIAMKAEGDHRRILLCFTCDPYPGSTKSVITRCALELFAEYDQAFQVLIKGGMYAVDDFDLYKPGDAYGATLTLFDPTLSSYWEPGASDPKMRMDSLIEAKKRGISTWASMEPVIYPEQTYKLYDATKEYVDRYAIGKLNYMEPPEPVYWRAFANSMIERCERDGKEYCIKDSLRTYLE